MRELPNSDRNVGFLWLYKSRYLSDFSWDLRCVSASLRFAVTHTLAANARFASSTRSRSSVYLVNWSRRNMPYVIFVSFPFARGTSHCLLGQVTNMETSRWGFTSDMNITHRLRKAGFAVSFYMLSFTQNLCRAHIAAHWHSSCGLSCIPLTFAETVLKTVDHIAAIPTLQHRKRYTA